MKIEIDLSSYPLYQKALEDLARHDGKDPEELAEELLFTKLIEEHREKFGSWV